MTEFRFTRSPRLNLRGSVPVTIKLENKRQLTANLYRLSLTGGLLELGPYVDERSRVTLVFQLGAGLLQGKAEMLFPMRGGMGYLQPFRFTAFGTAMKQTLELQIAALLKQTVGPNHSVGFAARPLSADSH